MQCLVVDFVDILFPVYEKEVYGGSFLFEQVLKPSDDMYGVTCGPECSEAVLALPELFVYWGLYPV